MKKILVYRFSAFGDIAMLVPVIKEFLDQNPDVEILMVTRKQFVSLFSDIPRLSTKGVDLNDYKGILGLFKLSKEILKEFKPDFIADLHSVLRTNILDFLFKIKSFQVRQLDKGRAEKKNLIDVKNTDKKPLKVMPERYVDVFRSLGFDVKLSHRLPQNNIQKEGIGFAPFAQHKGKMLPLEKSLELVRVLSSRNKVYLFGGRGEEQKVLDEWQNSFDNVVCLAGKMSLQEELEAIRCLEVMISMDSANMHLASLVGTRCISVWGATHPFAGFLGYGQSLEDVVQIEDLSCRPCSVFGNKPCFRGDWACLNELSIQAIIDKI